MPLNYTHIPELDFSRGIDQHSAENQIQPGYVEDALNVDIQEKRLVKRPGYQAHAGCLPIRVQELVYNLADNQMELYLDDSFDLSVILDTPIVVFGRSSIEGSGGDFGPTDVGAYYANVSTDPRKNLTGATTTLTDAGFTDKQFLVGVTQSTSTSTFDNQTVEMDRIEILNDFSVQLTHTIDPGQDPLSTFVYYLDTSNSTGQTYNHSIGTVNDGVTVNETISATTHNLDNFNVLVFIKADNTGATGDEFFEVDTVTIATSGDVNIQFTNDSGAALNNVTAILISAPSDQVKEGSFAASASSQQIVLSNIEEPFVFGSLYAEDLGTGELTLVKPDNVTYNDTLNQLTLDVTVGVSTSFKYFYEFGFTLTNVVKITPTTAITADASDQTPQLTIWGICHDVDGVYGPNKIAREGWVNHLDSYRAAGEGFLVAGLGGNLFTSSARTGLDAAYKLPQLLVDLRNRVDADTKIGPLFRGASSTFARERGYVNCVNGTTNFIQIDEIQYQSSGPNVGTVKYTMTATSHIIGSYVGAFTVDISTDELTISGHGLSNNDEVRVTNTTLPAPLDSTTSYYVIVVDANTIQLETSIGGGAIDLTTVGSGTHNLHKVEPITSVVSTTSGQEDWLTTQQCGHSKHNGSFKIKAVEEVDANTLAFYVENPIFAPDTPTGSPVYNLTASDYDETDVGGQAGVFTDQIPMDTTSYFLPGDELISDLFADTDEFEVLSSVTSSITVDNVFDNLAVPVGLRINGRRTSCVIPLRDSTDVDTVENFVAGDVVSLAGYERLFEVRYVNTNSDISLTSIIGNGAAATVTLASGSTANLFSGQQVQISNAGVYTGIQTIDEVTSATTFTFNTTETATETGILVGKNLCLGEAVEWADANDDSKLVTVDRRWIPIEAPDDNFDITPAYRISHFSADSYTDQSFIRSVMSADNMYFTNGSDTVKKYDGFSLYKAGLPRWQMNLFTSIRPGTGIVVPEFSISTSGWTDSIFTVGAGEASTAQVGDKIKNSLDDSVYTIRRIDTTNDKIFVGRNITGTTGAYTLTFVSSVYRYYFRLNAVDANNNLMASAPVGQEDTYVELAETSEVEFKLVGIPTFDNLDYNRLELEIYRTKRNQSAPFYKVVTLPLDFNQATGYVTYTDTAEDDALTQLDPINSSLLGAEIGTGWEEPMRAKYVTSADNRLVLANLTDYPQIDLVVDGTEAHNDNFDGLKWTFNRTSTIGTVTDNLDTLVVETKSTGDEAVGLSVFATMNSIDTGTDTITTAVDHPYVDGERVRVRSSVDLPEPLLENTDYYVANSTANTLQLATDSDGLNIVDLSTSGSGSRVIQSMERFRINASTLTGGTGAWSVGDWLYLFRKASSSASVSGNTFTGWWQVSSIDGDFLIIENEITELAESAHINRILWASDKRDVPVFLNDHDATDVDLNYQTRGAQPFGERDEKNVLVQRMANAINVHQRRTQDAGFSPWLSAHADGSYGQGQLIVRQPNIQAESFYVTLPTTDKFSLYLNGTKASSGSTSQSLTRIYPSRVIVSYPNYPEIFDSPTAILPQDSDSVIDVNSADGQQITGVIPFYGDSAFGAGQKEDMIVVFKENSIYIVNLANKAAGLNDQVVKKLESRGLGCDAPYSICSAKDSIFFANRSGIYRINRADLSIDFVGNFLERLWLEEVNRDLIETFHGHHYPIGKQYKLSVCVPDPDVNPDLDEPNQVYVYHHTEETAQGDTAGWTRYDNHPAVGWANLQADAFFASTAGNVFSVRRTGTEKDYRDRDEAISAEFTSRALDFGAPGIRKIIASVVSHYRSVSNIEGTELTYAYDLREEFLPTDNLTIDRDETTTGLSDSVTHKIRSIRSTLDRKRAIYFQIRYSNGNLDEPLDVAGFTVKLAGLSDKGILEAAETT